MLFFRETTDYLVHRHIFAENNSVYEADVMCSSHVALPVCCRTRD